MQEFLAEHTVKVGETTNARKEKLGLEEARSLTARATRLVSARGKKVASVDLSREPISDDRIRELMLGPTGNLRAPTLLAEGVLVVGYNEELYRDVIA